ncbi:nucleotidyltransferase family protein [Dongshaea marina]|uniref:nucleotidyltransferase family protein n=1 Tax=Dongshaea marina TaxID=2047966 RepID=UPI00131F1139|nr:NTP transferase domain-containing protein [Dongshaea marina]
MNTECIITAAGLSSRMGDWKLALSWKGLPLLAHSIANALAVCQQVIVVTGHQCDAIRDLLPQSSRIRFCHNPDYRQGLFSSLQAGVREVSCEHFFIAHGDMPLVRPETYQRLWIGRGEQALLPHYQGRDGHPVLLPLSYKKAILASDPRSRMKQLLRQLGYQTLVMDDPGVCIDVDTPEIYRALLKGEALWPLLQKQSQPAVEG